MRCPQCGTENSADVGFCHKCGTPLPSVANQSDLKIDGNRPGTVGAIWNPNAAANWSFLFTPAFGAYLQMLNWKTLGQPEKAASAKVWFYISLAILVVFAVMRMTIADDNAAIKSTNGLATIYLFVWYFAAARGQAKYVKEKLGTTYPRRPWSKPVLVGLTAFAVVMGAAFGIGKVDKAPDCAANKSLTTLKKAVAQQLNDSLAEKLQGSIDLTAFMVVDNIKTKVHDEKLDRYVCEGKLTYKVPAEKSARIGETLKAVKSSMLSMGMPAKAVQEQYGPMQYGQVMAVAMIPNFSVQPVEADITYEIQKLEGKGEKGTFEVKVNALSAEDTLVISVMEALAAFKYDAPAAPPVEQKSNPDGAASVTDAANLSSSQSAVAAVPVPPPAQEQPLQKPVEPVKQSATSPATDVNPSPQQGNIEASFECAKASSQIEKLICSSRETATADKKLSQHYSMAKAKAPDQEKLKKEQLVWMKDVRNKCIDSACLLASIDERIQYLASISK